MTQHRVELQVDLVDWLEAEPAIRAIRKAVFIFEQGLPEELEWMDSIHSVRMRSHGMTSVSPSARRACMQAEVSIGRMAALKHWRGGGVGRALLQTLLDLAARQGLSRVTLAD